MTRKWILLLIGSSIFFGQTKQTPKKSGLSKLMNPAQLTEKSPDKFRARFTTTRGEFVIAVTRDWSPLGADRFYNLVKNGFYNGCSFHRVLAGFVAQWGIHPNPAVQARWEKAPIKDESVKQSNRLGMVSFAASGAHTRSTQVFINLKENKSLDRQGFTPFGDVVQGIGISALIYYGYADKPNQDMIIKMGDAYLKKNFPRLDSIKQAVIE